MFDKIIEKYENKTLQRLNDQLMNPWEKRRSRAALTGSLDDLGRALRHSGTLNPEPDPVRTEYSPVRFCTGPPTCWSRPRRASARGR